MPIGRITKRTGYKFWIFIALAVESVSFDTSIALAQGQKWPLGCCKETELTYKNGDVELSAVLLMPTESGEFPAAVLIQGSGTSDRNNHWARLVAELIVSNGVAVLLTDKRGSGLSQGNWQTSSFDDLAKDSLAGIDALKLMDGLRKDRLGLIGLSQGGRVAPLAATLGEIDFVINMVGAAVPMKDQLYHELEQTYRQLGLDKESIDFLQRMTTLSFDYVETGDGFDEYLSHRRKVEERFGSAATASWPSTTDDDYWTFWRLNHDFDPIPYWREIVDERRIPAFIAYGELDEKNNVPVQASVKRLKAELVGGTLTLRVYRNTGHSLMDEDLRKSGRNVFVRQLRQDLEVWIRKNLLQ